MSQTDQHSRRPGPDVEPRQEETVTVAGGADASAAPSADATDGELHKNQLFHLLQNERRRAVLRYLEGREDEAVRMRDIAEQVAAWEHDTTLQALTSDERQRVYIALYQSHLGKLADAGVIEYNKPRGIVRTTDLFPAVVDYVETTPSSRASADDAWEQRYLGVTLLSSLLLAVSLLDLSGLQFLSGFVVSVLILGMFSGLTLLQVAESRIRGFSTVLSAGR